MRVTVHGTLKALTDHSPPKAGKHPLVYIITPPVVPAARAPRGDGTGSELQDF